MCVFVTLMNYLVEDVQLLTYGAVHSDTGIYCERITLRVLYLAVSDSSVIES